MANLAAYASFFAASAFLVLAFLLARQRHAWPVSAASIAACLISALWAGLTGISDLSVALPAIALQLGELAYTASWLFFLLILISLQTSGTPWQWLSRRWLSMFAGGLIGAAGGILVSVLIAPGILAGPHAYDWIDLVVFLGLNVTGLVLVEQLLRNADENDRWSLKFQCFGLGGLFAYGFFMYADALLFQQLNANLWKVRSVVSLLAVPLLALGLARQGLWQQSIHVSRQLVFHSLALISAGVYLLAMSGLGWLIRITGGSWGVMLQVAFLAASILLLFIVFFSGKVRAYARVLLNKHFFRYRYDYRDEWIKFSRALAGMTDQVPEGIIRIMARLADSTGGLVFSVADDGRSELRGHWRCDIPPGARSGLGSLPQWLDQTDWVIDLDELGREPELYPSLELPDWLARNADLWLIIPLVFRDRVEGVLMLLRSDIRKDLNWEDRDLLKTAGRQAASHLAQHVANDALVEARQFDAFNRLSAYVVHDLKNILAQQSLLVSNAAKHRHNPAFVDDMISTIANSVDRMNRLMEQMRSGERSSGDKRIRLVGVLRDVIEHAKGGSPAPTLGAVPDDLEIQADRERLGTVFSHLVKNAQEATPADGAINIETRVISGVVEVSIIDNGKGMSLEFMRDRLFKAFESTKGLTGMGIGLFESREYIRALGGDISVESQPSRGSTFRVTMPALKPDEE